MARPGLEALWWLARLLAFVLVLPVLIPAALLFAVHTDAGRDFVAAAVAELSGGQVMLEGLSGILPLRPRVARLELRDDRGAWLRVEEATLDLDLRSLFRGEIGIEAVTARLLALKRLPAVAEPSSAQRRLPWPVRLDRVEAERFTFDPVVPGATPLALAGEAAADRDGGLSVRVEATPLDRSDRYSLSLATDPSAHRFDLAIVEAPGGLLHGLAAQWGWVLPPTPGPHVRLSASGRLAGENWHLDSARVATEGGSLRAQGSLSADAVALDWVLDVHDLGVLLPGALGPVRAQGEVRGSRAEPLLAATAAAAGLTLPGAVRVAEVAVDARVSDLFGTVAIDGSARLAGLAAAAVTGDLRLSAQGPLAALQVAADAGLRAGGEPVGINLHGRLDGASRRLAVERLEARSRGETLRLLAPATIDLADGVGVDRLRLGLRQGAVEVAGRLAPTLAVDATVTGMPADLLRLVVPGLSLSGTLGAEARLTGADGVVGGSVRARAEGLRSPDGVARGLPPANVQVTAQLGANGVEIEARGEAGKGTRLGLTGRIGGAARTGPIALDLRADGRLDLALLDPLLSGAGRRVRGHAAIDGRVTGAFGAPRLDGSLRVAEGALWDRSLGVALTDVHGRLDLAGETLRVDELRARAGPGTLVLRGSVGLLAPGVPVDLRLEAHGARPLQRDELDLEGDADLRLTGRATERVVLAGAARFAAIDIRLPERLPVTLPTLEVREKGRRRAAPPGARSARPRPLDLGLDLTIAAPRNVTVRGRGVDAELGGEMRARGTLAEPALTGGFDLIRGQYTLVGQPVRFSRGRIGFDGAAGLDATVDLEARASAGGGTGILAVKGTASAPAVELRGEPEMPQNEVLSRLLFGVAGGRLTPWQAARLGIAAASLVGGQVAEKGPLARVRRGLGLSRAGVVGDEPGDAASEGARDPSDRTYFGARQSTRTGEPQGVLRLEASPRIQLEADVGPVGGGRAGVAFEHEF